MLVEDLTCALFLVMTDANARDQPSYRILLNNYQDHALNADVFSQGFERVPYDPAISGCVQPQGVYRL